LSLWILVTGKTQYLLDGLVLNIGDFVNMFPNMILQTFAFEDTGTWMSDWTLFFWAWWVAWASFVGMFLARISRGRTIRQFVIGTLTIPFAYILMWISIYGNSALDIIRSGDAKFGIETVLNPEGGFYELLSHYPAFMFIAGLATLTALLFYVTSADSAALVMANLSSRLPTPQHDGRAALRIFWAIATGALTISMLIVGGIGALQSATVIMGLPFSFVMILVMISLYRSLRVEARRLDSGEQAMPVSGRTTRSAEVRWQYRLGRMLTFPNAGRAREFEEKTLLPTLGEIVDELASRGITATCETHLNEEGERYIELEIDPSSEHPFHYQVFRKEAPAPQFGGRPAQAADKFVRMEVYLDVAASQGYDIMGYTREQLLDDVLDQYGRHLEFLQMQEFAFNAHEAS
ncbi:MAG: BCCT family transporter, partial [Halomonas sp.]|uniref:BCCT family transporter n=1 Tax=Halomonas sp. TaxID=1486246 RepID=UPI0017A64FCA